MKQNLFKELENAEIHHHNCVVHSRNVANNWQSYHYWVQVPYTHKFKVSCGGWLKTNWVHKTETRYRSEQRFDQNRYNTDLGNANHQVQLAQQNVANKTQAIINQINLMQQQINSKISEGNQIGQLKSEQNTLKQKLSQINSTCSNVQKNLTVEQNKLSLLQAKSLIVNNKINELSNKIILTEKIINDKQTTMQSASEELKKIETVLHNKEKTLENELSKMSDVQRAAIVYETMISDNKEVFEIVTKLGFDLACLSDIAFDHNNSEVFDFCMEMGVDFDNYRVSEKGHCLANKILLSNKEEIINKMLNYQEGALTNTIMQAAADPNLIMTIKKIYQHDKQLFQKNYIGASVLQVGIWHKNVELIFYIAENDPKALQGKTNYGESYFHLALKTLLDPENKPNDINKLIEIIKLIDKHLDIEDVKEECETLFKSNEYGLFQVVLNNVPMNQSTIKEFFSKAVKNYQYSFATVCLDSIKDVQALFTESVLSKDLSIIEYLMKQKSEMFNTQQLHHLLDLHEPSSEEYKFINSVIAQNEIEIDLDDLLNDENTNETFHVGEIILEDN